MLTNKQKVEIHHLFTERKLGFVEIARIYDVPASSLFFVVEEVEKKRKAFLEREPVVYRKRYKNPARKQVKAKTVIAAPVDKKQRATWETANTAMADAFKQLMLNNAKSITNDNDLLCNCSETSGKTKK